MERSYKNVVRPWEDVPERYTVLLKNRHDNGYAYAEAYEGNSLVTPSSGKGGFGNTFRIWLNSWDLVEKRPEPEAFNPWLKQAGGKHYTDMQEQPLQRTLRVKGYTAFAGACYTKVNKYMDRVKDNEAVQLAKAAHVLELWAYEAKKREEPEND